MTMKLQARTRLGITLLIVLAGVFGARLTHGLKPASQGTAITGAVEDFYPQWAAAARYLRPLMVVDTDSALGRRNLHPKLIRLKDMARMHGHLCDGLVTAWVELETALRQLFPDGIVDRADVRVVSKNGPCWVDAAAWMTGARINQGTLELDNSVGDGFIVQRISTGQTIRVSLRPGVYPAETAALERQIRSERARGETVSAAEIDGFESEANAYSRRLLNTPPQQVVVLQRLTDYSFPDHSTNPVAARSDIINSNAPRSKPPTTTNHKRGS